MNDPVNHPDHNTQGPVHDACGEVVECITVTEGMSFNLGNAVKYMWRHADKNGGTEAIQDLRKAAWYVQREIERLAFAAAVAEAADDEPEGPVRDYTGKLPQAVIATLGRLHAMGVQTTIVQGGWGGSGARTHMTGPDLDLPQRGEG